MDAGARATWTWTGVAADWRLTVVAPDTTSTAAGPVHARLEELDDVQLVRACIEGQRDGFDVIVQRHRKQVYQLCYRFVGNHEDASDLAQDVFVRAFRGLKSFKGQSSLSTWLYRIGVNLCLNHVGAKKLSVEPIEKHQPIDTSSESPSERVMRGERAARVRAAIAKLPAKQRAALVLRMYHDLPHQQIAEILRTSVGAVKANFFHALGNLRKLLGEEP
jgi:RNA polymerase sigma-70 factor, ECF subfamily